MDKLLQNPKAIALGIGAAIILLVILFRGDGDDSGSGQLQLYTTGLNPQQATELAALGMQQQTARLGIRTKGQVDLASIQSQNHYIDTVGDVSKLSINAKKTIALSQIGTAQNLGLAEINLKKYDIKTGADVERYISDNNLAGLKDTNSLNRYYVERESAAQNTENKYNAFLGAGKTLNNGFKIFTDWFNLGNLF